MARWQLFIRHAHRDTSDRGADNGLSAKGQAQGEALRSFLEKRFPLGRPKRVLSSPKRRCVETAAFVAEWAGVEIEIDPRLDEQGEKESSLAFRERVEAFWEESARQNGLSCVSHGDFLPLLLEFSGFLPREIKKADLFWMEEGLLKGLNAVHSSGIRDPE